MIAQMTQHVARGISRLPQMRKKKPNLVAFVSALLSEVQELEDAAWAVSLYSGIANAYGATLDLIGKVLDRARGGLSDGAYRIRLQVQLLLMRGSGTVPELVQMFLLLAPLPRTVAFVPRWPSAFEMILRGGPTLDGDDLLTVLRSAKGGGVKGTLRYSQVAPSLTLTTQGGGGLGLTQLGADPGTGGILARAVT